MLEVSVGSSSDSCITECEVNNKPAILYYS